MDRKLFPHCDECKYMKSDEGLFYKTYYCKYRSFKNVDYSKCLGVDKPPKTSYMLLMLRLLVVV